MADLNLTGTIELEADTSQAEKDAEKLGAKTAGEAKPIFDAIGKQMKAMAANLKTTVTTAGNVTRTSFYGGGIGAGPLGGGGGGGTGGGAGSGRGGLFSPLFTIDLVNLGKEFKNLTDQVIGFGRSLSAFSPSMAMTFAGFDVQMMIMKRHMGEELAPAMKDLLATILAGAETVMPLFLTVMKDLIGWINSAISSLSVTIAALPQMVEAIGNWERNFLNRGIDKAFPTHQIGIDANGNPQFGPLPGMDAKPQKDSLLDQIAEILRKQLALQQKSEDEKKTDMGGMDMGNFAAALNAPNSPQAQYQKQFHLRQNATLPAPLPPPRRP